MNTHALDAYPDVLTVQEAARILRISRNATYEAIRLGVLPALRIGRRILVPKRALERLLSLDGSPPAAPRM